jgi:hypothetical protein
MKTNMIARAWHKDSLVELGVASGFGFETESLVVKSEGII